MKFRNDFERRCWIAVVSYGTDFKDADSCVEAYRERNDCIDPKNARAVLEESAVILEDIGQASRALELRKIVRLLS